MEDETESENGFNPFDECDDIFQLMKGSAEESSSSVPPVPSKRPREESDSSSQASAAQPYNKKDKKVGDDDDSKMTDDASSPVPSREPPPARAKGCVHEVAIPPGWTAPEEPEDGALGTLEHPRGPENPVRTWKFTLDPFQQTSVSCIERRESVLVSAHTSAGKTVVAEYAIALALKNKQRVIYTSPIKALSNQKFRELKEEFGDVGLMTGDTTISPEATCLVMTTEILRSMLYRGSRIVREVAWVIFDEIHYLRNKERGVVWEETIIMLPDTVRMVFLSATIPNALEFAQWIAQTHNQPCHVVYTDMRPVPLQHYLFPAMGDGIHLVVDENGAFCNDNFQKALASLTPENMRLLAAQRQYQHQKGRGGKLNTVAPDCQRIVKMLLERHFNPLIVFAFSKREVESLALQMGKLDLLTDAEKGLVGQIFRNALASLSAADRQLPQIVNILPILLRGIAIHHSGLLPLLKEVIELLFQEGLIKVLFATETFSMGLNMPAKTVVFTSVRKFDGSTFRNVTSGEYIQMSGRAGRRGLDDRGIVVLMVDNKLEPSDIKNMVWGESDPLNSAFYVSYSMLLNLLRVDMQGAAACDPDSLVARSFRQFQARRALPQLQKKLADMDVERAAIVVPDEDAVGEYLYLRESISQIRERIRSFVMQPIRCLPYIQAGRLVHIVDRSPQALAAFGADIENGTYPEFDHQEDVSTADSSSDGKRKNKKNKKDPAPAADSQSSETSKRAIPAADGVALHGVDWGWGVVLGYQKKLVPEHTARVGADITSTSDDLQHQPTQYMETTYVVELCLECEDVPGPLRPLSLAARRNGTGPVELRGQGQIVMVTLDAIDEISSVRLTVPKDMKRQNVRNDIAKTIREACKSFDGNLPRLDPVTDMHVEDDAFRGMMHEKEVLEDSLHSDARFRSKELRENCRLLEHRIELDTAIRSLRHDVHEASREIVLASELHNMKRVLRRLGYISNDDVIETKGRVGAELTAGDELVLTELVFSGVFNDMSPERIAALVSCFVFEERVKGTGQEKLPPQRELVEAYRQIQETARRVATVWQECKIECDPDEYVSRFNPTIMEVILAWCTGATFADLLKMSDLYEGSLIRMMRRLEELLKELSKAAKAIGNSELESRFAEAVTKLHKDVVFAASLYL